MAPRSTSISSSTHTLRPRRAMSVDIPSSTTNMRITRSIRAQSADPIVSIPNTNPPKGIQKKKAVPKKTNKTSNATTSKKANIKKSAAIEKALTTTKSAMVSGDNTDVNTGTTGTTTTTNKPTPAEKNSNTTKTSTADLPKKPTPKERSALLSALGPPPQPNPKDSRTHQHPYLHAHREDTLMYEQARHLLLYGAISLSDAQKLAKPWHVDGEYSVRLSDTFLDPAREDTETEMWTEEKAKRAMRKRDREAEEWIRRWEEGEIDDWGVEIGEEKGKGKGKGKEKVVVESEEEEDEEEAKKEKKEKKKPALKKVASGRVTKTKAASAATSKPTPRLSMVVEEEEEEDEVGHPQPAKPAVKPAPAPASKRVRAKKSVSLPIAVGPGERDYAGYNYYQLVALCRDRGLASGGSALDVRVRLVEDDRLVRDGGERKDLAKGALKTSRGFKTEVPVLEEM